MRSARTPAVAIMLGALLGLGLTAQELIIEAATPAAAPVPAAAVVAANPQP